VFFGNVIACSLGVAVGGVLPLMGAIIKSSFGVSSFGTVKGLSALFLNFSALGPWFAAVVYDSSGSYENAWLVLGLALLPAVFASYYFSRD
jgi:cyanate permease